MAEENKKINLTEDQKVAELAKKSSNEQVRNTVKMGADGKVAGLRELPLQVLNEWFSEITNKLLTQHYVRNLDLSGVLAKLAPFRSPKQWRNGQMEVIASNIKVTTDYAKSLTFDGIFNTEDRENEIVFIVDTKKKESRVKVDSAVIRRAQGSAGNFLEFIADISSKLKQDLQYQMDQDNRADFIEQQLPALMINVEIDTSTITDVQEKYNLINKTLMNLSKKFVYPTTLYNQAGFVSSTTTPNQVVMWNDEVKTEIDSEVLAPTFNKELKELGIAQEGYQFAEGVYFGLADKQFINWDITMHETGTVNLDGFQTSYAERMWYGIDYIPFFNNVIVTEVAVAPVIRKQVRTALTEVTANKDKEYTPADVKFAKQLLNRLKMVETFEEKFGSEIRSKLGLAPIKKK